jgi:NADPH:quinone reductase-like Zn-dependent oxidoreductase
MTKQPSQEMPMKINGAQSLLSRMLVGFMAVLSVSLADAATMQAIVVTGKQAEFKTTDRPSQAGPGQVLIRVRAASVNPADWKMIERSTAKVPWVPGWDGAGTIEAVGAGVTTYRVGDQVIAFFERGPGAIEAAPLAGAYAQYSVASVKMIARKPSNISFEEAAGVPATAITAYKSLVDDARLARGQRVLIHGAAGGVGSAAVQIAKSRGAYVIATASPRNHEFLRKLGVDEVIDYNTVRFEERVKDLDAVLNTVDTETGVRSLKVLKPNGVIVSIVGPTPPDACSAAKVRCVVVDRTRGMPIDQVLGEVMKLVEAGQYAVNIDAKVPLADVSKAWEMNRGGHTRGKIVLTVP